MVVIAIIALLMGILMPALARVRILAYRLTCGTNLSGLGKAMMLYSNDFDGELPKAGARQNTWVVGLPDWTGGATSTLIGGSRQKAYGLTGAGSTGRVTLSASWYLLVKYAECTPKMFVCKGESDTRVADLRPNPQQGLPDIQSYWDFSSGAAGQESWRFYSYAYHAPFGAYALTTSCDAGMAVGADRNPWYTGTDETAIASRFSAFKPDLVGYPAIGTADEAKKGNSDAHQQEGQNVLYLDGHVEFEKRSYVGLENDNIYTQHGTSGGTVDRVKGILPTTRTAVEPANRQDSYLVNDPPKVR